MINSGVPQKRVGLIRFNLFLSNFDFAPCVILFKLLIYNQIKKVKNAIHERPVGLIKLALRNMM